MPETEILQAPGKPRLYVNANVIEYKTSDGRILGYVYNIGVHLYQGVILERNYKVLYEASTWNKSFVGITPILNDIRAHIKDRIDVFINDYLSVNPKNP